MTHGLLIRRAVRCAAAFAVVGGVATLGAAPDQSMPGEAVRLLGAARRAIGIEPGGQGPGSLRMVGTRWTSQAVSAGEDGVRRVTASESALEARIGFPDRYVDVRVTGPFEIVRGFDGTTAFQRAATAGPGAQTSSSVPSAELVALMRRDLARLAVGMLARTDVLPSLEIEEAGRNAVRLFDTAAGRARMDATLEFDPATGLPRRLVWRMRMRVLVPGSVLGQGGGGAGPVGPDAPEETVTMAFDDHRKVRGLTLPFRVAVLVRGIALEELRFDRIDLNPSFAPGDFK